MAAYFIKSKEEQESSTEEAEKERHECLKAMEASVDEIYGEGLRDALAAYAMCGNSLKLLLQRVRDSGGALPKANTHRRKRRNLASPAADSSNGGAAAAVAASDKSSAASAHGSGHGRRLGRSTTGTADRSVTHPTRLGERSLRVWRDGGGGATLRRELALDRNGRREARQHGVSARLQLQLARSRCRAGRAALETL